MESLYVLFYFKKCENKIIKEIKCITTSSEKILEGIKAGYSAQLADLYILDEVDGEYIGQKCEVAEGVYEWKLDEDEEGNAGCQWVKIK